MWDSHGKLGQFGRHTLTYTEGRNSLILTEESNVPMTPNLCSFFFRCGRVHICSRRGGLGDNPAERAALADGILSAHCGAAAAIGVRGAKPGGHLLLRHK